MTDRVELYISTDIECDGPCPGKHSMLSLASVAFDARRGVGLDAVVGEFSVNLERLPPPARPDADTMKWWTQEEQREAWLAHRVSPVSPFDAMDRYAQWLKDLPGVPIFVGHPAGFDFTFVYYYLHMFADENPFVRNAIDVETYAMARLGSSYLGAAEQNWPAQWRDLSIVRTHVALDDARGQGVDFMRMMADRSKES